MFMFDWILSFSDIVGHPIHFRFLWTVGGLSQLTSHKRTAMGLSDKALFWFLDDTEIAVAVVWSILLGMVHN